MIRALLTIVAVGIFASCGPQVTHVLTTPKKCPEDQVWQQASSYAVDNGDFMLLSAMFDSNIELARNSAISRLSRLPTASGALDLLFHAYQDIDPKVKYHAMHGIYRIASDSEFQMRDEGVVFPAHKLFENDRNKYLSSWDEWIRSNKSELRHRVALKEGSG